MFIDELDTKTIEGITISNLTITSVNDIISIVGIAEDRSILNLFKESLQSSSFFTNIELPITNLEQKAKIPFSITLKLKDPNMLYYK